MPILDLDYTLSTARYCSSLRRLRANGGCNTNAYGGRTEGIRFPSTMTKSGAAGSAATASDMAVMAACRMLMSSTVCALCMHLHTEPFVRITI